MSLAKQYMSAATVVCKPLRRVLVSLAKQCVSDASVVCKRVIVVC